MGSRPARLQMNMNTGLNQRPDGTLARQIDDPRVIEALEDYLGALHSGSPPDRQSFLDCLALLESGSKTAKNLFTFDPWTSDPKGGIGRWKYSLG